MWFQSPDLGMDPSTLPTGPPAERRWGEASKRPWRSVEPAYAFQTSTLPTTGRHQQSSIRAGAATPNHPLAHPELPACKAPPVDECRSLELHRRADRFRGHLSDPDGECDT